MPAVRTRFAPSPTGYMHIGGMRTALFNWLFARRHGGQFILRIDDTDRVRNIDEALGPIFRAFRWLDLMWDEGPDVGGNHGPYFQSQRFDLYRAAAERMLAEKKAFRDFDPPEVSQADRAAAEREKRTYLNVRRALDLSEDEVARRVAAGEPHVVRFLMPRAAGRKLVIDDAILGPVEFDVSNMPDPVIMRGDGSPLYNFATVIDDAAMEISHVIRAQEHLSNTPIQALLHEALGHAPPVFAHIPYVAAPGSKEKLSKRKLDKYKKNPLFKKMFEQADRIFPKLGIPESERPDPVMVEYYERIGYLPVAVINALARIGWSLDDKTDLMDRETIVANFDLARVVKSPAGFDPDKLDSFQQHWMGELSMVDRVGGVMPFLRQARLLQWPFNPQELVRHMPTPDAAPVIELLQDRFGDGADIALDVEITSGRVVAVLHEGRRLEIDPDLAEKLSALEFATRTAATSKPDVPPELAARFNRVLQSVLDLVQLLGERLKVFGDILDFDYLLLPDDAFPYDEKAFDKRIRKDPAPELLRGFRERLAAAESFDAASLEASMKGFVEERGAKLGDIIHAVRVAVTGQATGPGMFETLEFLGREKCLARIDRALAR
ncbi:MAG: glutamate--tRNA ligase family protein [Planctomycetaceae bacterium]